ncbi:TMV resistance protein N-like [Cynara cardunculus var. scolymus]|uniref:TMV resistance protein N-like n=1 Tax=Cynara cardunculus var. scolymus TaxID=59895 RepID=UPI000D622FD6|nr:TMV resistance protein N-like [Cynara cardunculus var. scolymus]
MASSSSSLQSWNHDLFLSFRGTDTRTTFVDHLYSALVQQGIYTYKDDQTLPRGEIIGPSLLKAIEESQIAVIVFSESYADSCWCLQELAHIMKCKDERGQIVMPIFYHMDPSELRNPKRKYGEAFAKHESENKNVEFWRKALADAGNLSGYVANGPETLFIKHIVDTISNRLCAPISSDDENLIGIKARLQDLKSKMEMESDGVLMVGIWGLGGGGKTTLASSLYDEISSNFEGSCFLKDVREESRKHVYVDKWYVHRWNMLMTEVITITDVLGMENGDGVLEVSNKTERDEEKTMRAKGMWLTNFKVELVPDRNQGDDDSILKDATYLSNFWDEEFQNQKTFEIISDSKSSIQIQWDTRSIRSELFVDI